jgi:NADP-dependent 3-hydroxy acid dehydrogenase YdfG
VSDISKAVLITGCSTGIGRATAERLARKGHTVYASARKLEAIEDLEDSGCNLLELDVCDERSMQRAVKAVEKAEGAVGVLINNAGYAQSGAVETISPESMRRQFDTNVFGLVRMCQLVLPGMREQRWGRIVNISSIAGRMVFPGAGMYHATKHAVEAISDALRFEVQEFGVGVTIVEPGFIRTHFSETVAQSVAEGNREEDAYARFNRAVVKRTASAYEGPLALLGGTADSCASAIEKAIEKDTAPVRVPVTLSAHLLLAQRRITPDRLWDLAMRLQFPRPR